jgi:hypothetical protein
LAQGKESNAVRTATSYFDPVWNAFSKHTDGSMEWIPKQIVAIGEDFHSQVGDGKVRTTLYKEEWPKTGFSCFQIQRIPRRRHEDICFTWAHCC